MCADHRHHFNYMMNYDAQNKSSFRVGQTLWSNKERWLCMPPLRYFQTDVKKMVRRFQKAGKDGLVELSRRPHHSPNRKALDKEIAWISQLRKQRLGSRRIQNELLRNYAFSISRPTLCKVLRQLNVEPLKKSRILRKHRHRYERPIPGERIQINTCKIAPGLYQYTAVDDCTRIRCLALFNRRTAANSLLFLEQMIEEIPFPIRAHSNRPGLGVFCHQISREIEGIRH